MFDGELHEFFDAGVGDRGAVGERVDGSAGGDGCEAGCCGGHDFVGKGTGEVGLTGLYRYLCFEG